jgi:hypothetical protein
MATNQYQQSVLNKSRVDKFKLVFQLPNALKKINKRQDRKNTTVLQDSLQFSIYGTVVPSITVPALEIRYSGSTLYNSSHSKNPYPPVTVNFTIDNEYNNYWVIYKWLDLLHSEYTGVFDADDLISDDVFKDYQTDLTVYGLDEFNNEKIKFTYTKAFPTDIGGINFNYRDSAEIESSFTFVYSQMHTALLN